MRKSAIEIMVQQAFKDIDKLPDYKIPRIEQWKRQNKKNKICACKSCGVQIEYVTEKAPIRCSSCKAKISYLFKKRTQKKK